VETYILNPKKHLLKIIIITKKNGFHFESHFGFNLIIKYDLEKKQNFMDTK